MTSVGGTQVDPNIVNIGNTTAGQLEVAVSGEFTIPYYSGGGFSDLFTLPSYQQSAVNAYQSSNAYAYSSDQYNTSGQSRGFPDVSANGWSQPVVVGDGMSILEHTLHKPSRT